MTRLTGTPLEAEQLDSLAWFLNAAGLPGSDLAEPNRIFFRFDADDLVGYAGLEGRDADRLLRSVIVVPDRRNAGLGRSLIVAVETLARHMQVSHLHLLTTTAAPFFRAVGYVDAERSSAPPSITASREFAALCPSSATYLVKAL